MKRAVAILLVSYSASAGNILRRAGVPPPLSPDASAAAAAAQAQAAMLQANSPLRRALEAIRQAQAAQDAARAAAQGAAGGVPDGLAPGGLVIAPGAPPIGASDPNQTVQNGRTEVTITQSDPRAVLTWTTFNVGQDTDVHFDQTLGGADAASWVALNRVIDPGAAPSRILGSIRAEGQVYLLNRNGILFGGASQVNVGSLLVSGLDIAGGNQRFLGGTLYDLAFAGGAGNVTLEEGARIVTAGYGRAVLLGENVVNRGSIESPDGQVILAAGSAVTLSAAPGLSAPAPPVRGLAPPLVSGDGVAENAGLISTPRGNITLVGADTRQNGLLTATTGAEANGSIYLGADGALTTFGAGSVTQVLPDDNGKKVIGTADFKSSRIEAHGDKISALDGSTLYAPGGDISLSAVMTTDPTGAGIDDTRVYVGSGARIDVSGLREVEVPMETNSIQAELRANELRDDPLLRNNPALRGHTVWFDGRLGVDPSVANLSGYYDLLERDVKLFMTRGGTVSLAANQIITRAGSTIDLSGGSLRYLDGYVRSSQLIDLTGKLVRIENAVPGVPYIGLDGDFVRNHARWGLLETYASSLTRARPRFEQGYEEGGSAGTLRIGTNDPAWYVFDLNSPRPKDPSATGAVRIFDGDVAAGTVAGIKQRESPSGSTDPTRVWREQPAGATLDISRAGDVTIGNFAAQLGADFSATSAVEAAKDFHHLLPSRWFDGKTFGAVSISSGYDPDETLLGPNADPGSVNRAPGGHLEIAAGTVVNLGDGGRFSFSGKGAEIDGTLLAPGGKISLTALQRDGSDGSFATIHLGSTGVIDAAGRFSNDRFDGQGPLRALNGGSVSLIAANVLLDAGSLVDVSGGARLDGTGKKLSPGNGGSIAIDVSRYPTPILAPQQASQGTLAMNGDLRGYALGRGGSLSLVTPFDIVIDPGARVFNPQFFTRGGFASYSLIGERGVTITRGTDLAPSAETLVAPVDAALLPTGTRLDDVAARAVLPEGYRNPMSLSLSTIPTRPISDLATQPVQGYALDLDLQEGATIRMDPGSSVQLSANDVLRIDGIISAPGGNIALSESPRALSAPLAGPSVQIGDHAQILAAGYVQTSLEAGLVRRTVKSGGTVSISTPTDLSIDPSSVIDVSGISAVADLSSPADTGSRTQAIPVAGNAGAVSISASSGLVVGDLRLSSGGDSALGGSLSIVKAQGSSIAPLIVGQDVPKGAVSSLTVVADSIDKSGADDLLLQVIPASATEFQNASAILFDGNVDLHTGRTLSLLSPILGTTLGSAPASVTLASGYVSLQGSASAGPKAAGAANLNSDLTVRAGLIDVSRLVVLGCVSDPSGCPAGGFGTARFIASGDIRLADHDASGNTASNPGLLSTGALEFQSAQVYVASRDQASANGALERAADDPGFLVESDRSITVTGNGAPAPVPFSFGERLTLRAPSIEQGGVVRAPQGQIRLEGTGANGSVTLLPGSLTSSSLEGAIIPFGAVQSGGIFFGYDKPGQSPSKSVRLDAPAVSVQQGAVIDVSGGGDLLGYVFVPGNGGSRDVLAASGGFAVVSGLGSGAAPLGPVDSLRDSRLRVGDSVWLQGVPGLADGYYTLLPEHYALLPGGFLVEPMGGAFATAPDTMVRPDGAVIAGGYRTLGGTPGYGQFLVMSRDVFGRYSDLVSYSFDARPAAFTRTPYDAGAVVLDASRSLTLEGSGRFGAGQGGLLGDLDISAPKIAVLGAGAVAPDTGYLQLDPQALSNFGAGSVLLGGTRSQAADGVSVAVNASDVYVATGATPWTSPEIILVGKSSVTVADGSVIRARGAPSADTSPLLLSGDGALLRLSTGGRAPLVRSGAIGAEGDLDVGNATLSADASLALDGGRSVSLAAESSLSARQLDLASVRVNLGDAPPDAPGVTLGADKLSQLGSASDLLIRGYGSIHLYGDLTLGGRTSAGAATLRGLTLDTGLLQGDGAGAAIITAGDLTLRNSGGGAQGSGGTGTLALDVDALHLGPGQVQLAGYASLLGSAGTIEASGSGGLSFAGNVSLATARLGAASGADYSLDVGGDLALTSGGQAAGAASSLGGRLTLRGATVLLDTSVALPAGRFEATANSGNLTLGEHAVIDVRGSEVDFREVARFAPGGAIVLDAKGDLAIAAGATLDVSAAAQGGSAGAIELTAGGKTSVLGSLRGSSGASFSLDTGTLDDFSGLNSRLAASGFDSTLAYRLRHQDILLGAGERIAAREVLLQSDDGRVTVAGEIAAGSVQLIAGNGVSVQGTIEKSGEVTVVATGGRIDVAPGSVIDAKETIVRAQRDGNDVAVDRIAGKFTGEVVVQGVQDYQAGAVDAALTAKMIAQASAWLQASKAQVKSRLGNVQVAPGMVVHSRGDLGIDAPIDLSPLAAPGYLGFVAAGDIDVKASVSDGFSGATRDAHLLGGRSFSLGFQSGGDISLQSGVIVRTGAGDISLRAGRDLHLLDPASVAEAPAVIYTARGGDIELRAGRDILAPFPAQTTSAWLARNGDTNWSGDVSSSTVKEQASWSIVFQNFESAVGALGGGDVLVSAGRDVRQLQVAIPTTGHLTTPAGAVPREEDLVVEGGGDLHLTAGRDILGGLFMLGRGHAELRAFGNVAPSDTMISLRTSAASADPGPPQRVGVLFGLMDATATVTAGGSVVIEGAFDPMREGQLTSRGSSFWGYSDRAALDATALSGSLTYHDDPWAAVDLSLSGRYPVRMSGSGLDSLNDLFSRAPPTLRLASLQASIFLDDRFGNTGALTLAPAPLGTLELLAKGDVHLALASIKLEDIAVAYRRGALDPYSTSGDRASIGLTVDASTNFLRGFTPSHAGDKDPARIIALDGSVCAQRSGACTEDLRSLATQVAVPKPIEVFAGLDVMAGTWQPQNNGAEDISLITAGRDVYEPALQIAGPGAALVQAGRDVVLNQYGSPAKGGAVFSLGNRDLNGQRVNQALPSGKGADLYILAGAARGADYESIAAKYLDPSTSRYLPQLAAYMKGLGYGPMSDADLVAAFKSLPLARREIFLDGVYFEELKETGIDYNDPASPRFHSYSRGFDAVALLFPGGASAAGGNVVLNAKPLETQTDASITILAPYGSVSVGADVLPRNVDPASGGVVTRRGGDVHVMSEGNIDLFTSRIFTLEGGDVTLWTSEGSITAGSGAKTSVFQKPLVYTIDNAGVIAVDAFGLQTGAGIGVLDALLGSGTRRRSRLDLIAPKGEVNAGDAGIRVVGDLNIAAQVVVGAENIQASGASLGVPKVDAPNLGALTSASQVAQAAAKEGVGPDAQPRTALADLPSIITVEVVGYETTDDEKRKKK